MSIPTFVGVGAKFESNFADAATGFPSGWQADDIFIMPIAGRGNDAIPAISGWSDVEGSPQGSGVIGTRLTVRWKRAQVGDVPPTIPSAAMDHVVGGIMAFRGCLTSGDPWDSPTSSGTEQTADTSLSVPGHTTLGADRLVVIMASNGVSNVGDNEWSGWANADLANILERVDYATQLGDNDSIGVATGEKSSAGAFGATTATVVHAGGKSFIALSLVPQAAVIPAKGSPMMMGM